MNSSNSTTLPHGPAQKVAHMRVSRKPVHKKQPTQEETAQLEQGDDEPTQDNLDHLEKRQVEERVARDLQSHQAARQPDVSANPGSNVKQIHQSNAQPRGLSH